jgi:hypothetical protein
MKKLLTIVLFAVALTSCSKLVSLPSVPSAEDMALTGTGLSDDTFTACVDRVWPEKKLNQEIKDRYWDNSSRISKVCRRFGASPNYNDYVVCCESLKK